MKYKAGKTIRLYIKSFGADNTSIVGSIPIWPVHLGAGLDHHCVYFSAQNIL